MPPKKTKKKTTPKKSTAKKAPAKKKVAKKATSAPKVIYLEADEEVSTTIDRIRRMKSASIALVIPKRASILSSLVSLKLLHRQSKTQKKKISIITEDKKGRDLAAGVGFPIYSKLEEFKSGKAVAIKISKKSSKTKTTKTATKTGKKTIADIVSRAKAHKKKEKARKSAGFHAIEIRRAKSLEEAQPNKKLLIGFVGVTLVLLGAVLAVVLPNATIELVPKSDVLEYVTNITLADEETNYEEIKDFSNNLVASFPIETEVEVSHTYKSTGVASTGAQAVGFVTIFNSSSFDWPLVASTRLRSPDGLIFRLDKGVIVPSNSKVKANVTADPLDELGKVVGDKANIGPSKFTIPGLREANQKVVYAESTEPMVGGVTEAQQIVSEDDLNGAKEDIVKRAKEKLMQDLSNLVMAKSTNENKNLVLLDIEEALEMSVSEVAVEGDIPAGHPQNEFTVSAKVAGQGVAYDKDRYNEILRRGLTERVHPNMKLTKVDYDASTHKLLNYNQGLKKHKVETNIRGVTRYEIEEYFAEKIKQNIAGKTIPEARDYLSGQDFIARVRIKMWPFWLSKIPSVADNIRVTEEEE